MSAKKILPKIFLFLGFLALFIIVRYRVFLRERLLFEFERAKIHIDNFFFETGPGVTRKKPLSLLEREAELKLYVAEPFRSFSDNDWREFWDIIYLPQPIERLEKKGLPNKMRQLSEDEIAFELMERYPQPFANFREEHWKMFFGIIFKK